MPRTRNLFSAAIFLLGLAGTAYAAQPTRSERPGWLGFGFVYHHPPTKGQAGWLYVQRVAADGPAAKAGLHVQDLILTLDGKPLMTTDDAGVLDALAFARAGKILHLGVARGTQHVALSIFPAPMSDM